MSMKIEIEGGFKMETKDSEAKERVDKLYDYLVKYCAENHLSICGTILAREPPKELLGIKMPEKKDPIGGCVVQINASTKDMLYSMDKMARKKLREVLDDDD